MARRHEDQGGGADPDDKRSGQTRIERAFLATTTTARGLPGRADRRTQATEASPTPKDKAPASVRRSAGAAGLRRGQEEATGADQGRGGTTKATKATRPTKRANGNNGQGQNWVRPERRLAINLRDGLACVWCSATLEDDVLTLDHLRPRSKGGDNTSANLVTACRRCNSSRGNRTQASFARAVAGYLNGGATPEAILAHVGRCRRRALDVPAARALIALRGGFSAAQHAA